MSYIITLRVDGYVIRVDAKIVFHLLVNFIFRKTEIFITFAIYDVVGYTISISVLHHISASMNDIHAIEF